MGIKEKISDDLHTSLKAGNELEVSVLRLLKSAIHNEEIAKKHELSDEEVQQVIGGEIKRRREAIEQYTHGERVDLAKKEQKELEILQKYQPEQLSDAELKQIVTSAIEETRAQSPADFGKVMGAVMPKVKGKADGARVSEWVKKELG